MAKNRYVNTKFWIDSFVLDKLDSIDKLFFLYLLTNPYTDISGVYELPIKLMAFETGIDRQNMENVIIPRFEKHGKILYRDGWIAIKNFHKHQILNPKVIRGIEIGLNNAPKELKDFWIEYLVLMAGFSITIPALVYGFVYLRRWRKVLNEMQEYLNKQK